MNAKQMLVVFKYIGIKLKKKPDHQKQNKKNYIKKNI